MKRNRSRLSTRDSFRTEREVPKCLIATPQMSFGYSQMLTEQGHIKANNKNSTNGSWTTAATAAQFHNGASFQPQFQFPAPASTLSTTLVDIFTSAVAYRVRAPAHDSAQIMHSVLDDKLRLLDHRRPHHARRRSHRQPSTSLCSHLTEKLLNIVSKKMFIFSLIAITQASTIGTTPCTALIGHERLDDNFAYSTAEAHAYADAWMANFQPAPIVGTHHAAQPIFQDVPVHASVPASGPDRIHQTVVHQTVVHQPIVHETWTHSVQAVDHVTTHATPAATHVANSAVTAVSATYEEMDKRKVTDAVPGEQGGPVHSVLDDNFACSTTDAPTTPAVVHISTVTHPVTETTHQTVSYVSIPAAALFSSEKVRFSLIHSELSQLFLTVAHKRKKIDTTSVKQEESEKRENRRCA